MATTTGKYLSGTVGGVAFAGLVDWSVDEHADELDSTDANSLGTEQTDAGVIGPTISVNGYHKLNSGPFPTFRAGAIVSNLILYANTNTAAATWTFTRVMIAKANSSAAVRGQIKYSFTARNAENAAGTGAASYTGPTA